MFANQQQIVLTVISLNLFAKHGTSSRFLLPLQPVQKISGGKDCGSFIWPVWVLVSCSVSKIPFLLRQPPTQISFVIPNMGLPVKPIWKLPRNSNDFYKCRGLSPPNLSSLLPLQILSIPLMVSAVPSSVVWWLQPLECELLSLLPVLKSSWYVVRKHYLICELLWNK